MNKEIKDAQHKGEPPLKCTPLLSFLIFIGASCIVFVVAAFTVPGIAPVKRRSHSSTTKIISQGNLVVYPIFANPENNYTYLIHLPGDVATITTLLQEKLTYYPTDSSSYADCYMEAPSRDKPCYFNFQWLGSNCNQDESFGYIEVEGVFNPCLIFRFEEVGDWTPGKSKTGSKIWDTNFSALKCYSLSQSKFSRNNRILVRPVGGFANSFFPVTDFNTTLYRMPSVTVQVLGLAKGDHVTIECMLIANKAPQLWNNGIVRIRFQA